MHIHKLESLIRLVEERLGRLKICSEVCKVGPCRSGVSLSGINLVGLPGDPAILLLRLLEIEEYGLSKGLGLTPYFPVDFLVDRFGIPGLSS